MSRKPVLKPCILHAEATLPFSLKGGFNFLKTNPPQKNSENLRIFQSHNLLSARCLQKNNEASIYNNAENSENFGILQSHNRLTKRHLHKLQLFAVDNGRAAALRLAVFQPFSLLSRHSAATADQPFL
jgi:hypothetical protein